MLLATESSSLDFALQYAALGLSKGALFALIALGYTMVYGIVELINFAHGDLFMLGTFLALTIFYAFGVEKADTGFGPVAGALALSLVLCPLFCAALNVGVNHLVYRPLRNAPKLAPLVSAIGVSFIFMNAGLFWGGPQDVNFPNVIPSKNLIDEGYAIPFSYKEVLILAVTLPLLVALSAFVRLTPLGTAMRATAQNPVAAQLMGINTERVIATTFAIGGALAGAAGVIYGLTINTISYTIGFQNGLYAFTAAVLGGIGNFTGAVLGGLLIGLVTAFGSAYVGDAWANALVFGILIVILVFRPAGLLGSRTREKV